MPGGMKEVAKRAGVSITTVSHVMNKTRHVSPETRQRVLGAVRELSYFKDARARHLARGRSDFLGLIVSDICNPFFPDIVKSFETAALAKGLDLLLCNTNYDPERTEAAVRKMIENKVRGVAMMTSEWGENSAEELKANQVGVVFLDLGPVGKYSSNIRVNYAQGVSKAIEHLHGLGHKQYAFIGGPQNLRSAVIRRDAFIDGMKYWALPFHRIAYGNHRVDGGAQAAQSLLAQSPLPTAVLCSNDLTAIGAMNALAEAGVRVPEDVSVVGFDNIASACLVHPPLTTVNLSRERLGALAFEALHKMLRSKRREGTEYVIDTELIIRQSTAVARCDALALPLIMTHSAPMRTG